MPSIKNRILEYFDRNQVANVSEISATLGVTKPNIHYHIKNLIHAGVLEIFENYDDKYSGKKGRPVVYFRRTNKSKKTNFRILAENLMHLYLHEKDVNFDDSRKLYKLAKRLAGNQAEQAGTLIQQLQNAVAKLETLNYEPHWEIAKSGPMIYFRHCPYADILSDFPMFCKLDEYLLEILTLRSPNQTGKIHESVVRPPACVFVIQP